MRGLRQLQEFGSLRVSDSTGFSFCLVGETPLFCSFVGLIDVGLRLESSQKN